MDDLIKADIFFFISSIGAVIVTIILSIAGYYVILIVRDAKYISGKLRNATDELEEKLEAVKEQISENGRRAKYVVDFFLGRFMGKRKTKSKSRKDDDSE